MSPIPISALNTVRRPIDAADGEKIVFKILVPSQLTRETLHMRLYELGCIAVTDQTLRATIVNEMFEIWPEDVATQNADFISNFWDLDDGYGELVMQWAQQEQVRVAEENEGAPKREPTPQPPQPFSTREKFKAQSILDEVAERSRRYRALLSKRSDWSRAQKDMIARLAVKGVEGRKIVLELDEADDVLTEATLEAIKTRLGMTAYGTLTGEIDALYRLGADERKNSVSPAGSGPPQNGSPAPNTDGAETGGSSTTSSTTSRPDAGSEMTTERSSRIGSRTKRGPTKTIGRTAARLRSNRSNSAQP